MLARGDNGPADPAWLRDRLSDGKCLKIAILSFSAGKIVVVVILFYSSFYGACSGHAHRAISSRYIIEVPERTDGYHGGNRQFELLADFDGPHAFLDVKKKLPKIKIVK